MLIQIILTIILLAALVVTWRRMRQGVISWREAALWSVLWVAASVVIVLPETTSIIARMVGIGRGVDLAIYASVTLLFVLVFKIFLSLDKIERNLTDMVRKDALRDIPDHPEGSHDG